MTIYLICDTLQSWWVVAAYKKKAHAENHITLVKESKGFDGARFAIKEMDLK